MTINQTKRQILRAVAQIEKVAKATGMTGQVALHLSGLSVEEWETLLTSITEYKVYRHYVSVSDRLQIALLLD